MHTARARQQTETLPLNKWNRGVHQHEEVIIAVGMLIASRPRSEQDDLLHIKRLAKLGLD